MFKNYINAEFIVELRDFKLYAANLGYCWMGCDLLSVRNDEVVQLTTKNDFFDSGIGGFVVEFDHVPKEFLRDIEVMVNEIADVNNTLIEHEWGLSFDLNNKYSEIFEKLDKKHNKINVANGSSPF